MVKPAWRAGSAVPAVPSFSPHRARGKRRVGALTAPLSPR
jgi:hypothetical protein